MGPFPKEAFGRRGSKEGIDADVACVTEKRAIHHHVADGLGFFSVKRSLGVDKPVAVDRIVLAEGRRGFLDDAR